MKRLFLIRHAKSSWENTQLDDIDRPLSEKGVNDASKVGMFLSENIGIFDRMISSPANRAYSTAIIIAQQMGYDPENIEINKSLYTFSDSDVFMNLAQKMDDKYETIAMFGHNFAIEDAANRLASGNIEKCFTCGVLEAVWDEDKWENVTNDNTIESVFFFPKMLK